MALEQEKIAASVQLNRVNCLAILIIAAEYTFVYSLKIVLKSLVTFKTMYTVTNINITRHLTLTSLSAFSPVCCSSSSLMTSISSSQSLSWFTISAVEEGSLINLCRILFLSKSPHDSLLGNCSMSHTSLFIYITYS